MCAEIRIDTHDLSVPIRGTTKPGDKGVFFHLVVVSAADVGTVETDRRLACFHSLHRGVNVAVVFLLYKDGGECYMSAYQQLQLE